MCGVSARRKAADLIAAGRVTVNGTMSDEPGYRVQPTDKIAVDGKSVRPVSKIYLMMNKPKDTITTMSDERDRNTVIDVLRGEVPERVFAVGRLDRNTTGLLLMTNDGDLAVKLSHPSTEVSKVYRATLDKPFPKIDLAALRGGVELHDRGSTSTVREIRNLRPNVHVVAVLEPNSRGLHSREPDLKRTNATRVLPNGSQL